MLQAMVSIIEDADLAQKPPEVLQVDDKMSKSTLAKARSIAINIRYPHKSLLQHSLRLRWQLHLKHRLQSLDCARLNATNTRYAHTAHCFSKLQFQTASIGSIVVVGCSVECVHTRTAHFLSPSCNLGLRSNPHRR